MYAILNLRFNKTMIKIDNERTDREGYNEEYKGNVSKLSNINNSQEYIEIYRLSKIGPYYKSGNTKGYVRGESIKRIILDVKSRSINPSDVVVLDAGSGQGELSVYLACLGFNVIGVDISEEAKVCGEYLASNVGVDANCAFLAESLEATSIEESSVDYVIGHASLHHFIKYDGVSGEFYRVMKPGAKGYFSDSFGENRLYHIFHDKEKMHRLGDVTLTKKLIENYFSDFDVNITPTDWFVMLDKLYLKLLPRSFSPVVKKLSALHHYIDRMIPSSKRLSLYLSGGVLTEIRKPVL